MGKSIPGSNADDAYLKWKGQAWADWNYRGVKARLTGTYYDSFNDLDLDSNPFKVKSTIFLDFQASYNFFPAKSSEDQKGWSNTSLTVGVSNFLDKNPPQAFGEGGNSNGYPGFLYSDEGRFVYMKLEKKL